jgi:hypothetical protein
MDIQTIIQYLEIFGLTVFGLFFLILLVISIYLITVIKLVKKAINVIFEDTHKIVSFIDQETQTISSLVKSKITAIDIEKIIFGSTFLGAIIAGLKNSFKSKSDSRTRSKKSSDS